MISFKGFLAVFLLYSLVLFHYTDGRISNERKCADNKCSVPISMAKTLLRYNTDDERILSFPRNADAKIFSKEAGDRLQFWEAEINGKRGYVPKEFLRETKLLVKKEEVNVVVSTGRDDSKLNTTEEVSGNPSVVSTEHVMTPALPSASSKGFFGIMGGVSADSVPPNTPDIQPQTTDPYQVVDGTTIYDESAPDIANNVRPSSEKDLSLKTTLEDSKFDNKLKAESILTFKESIDSIQKPTISFAEQSQMKEKSSDNNPVAGNDQSDQKEVFLESMPDVKEIHIETSGDGNDLSKVNIADKEDHFARNIIDSGRNNVENEEENTKNVEQNKVKVEENLNDNSISQDKVTNKEDKSETLPIESSGIFNNILDQVTNLISSGTGEILNEVDDDGYNVEVKTEKQHESSGESTFEENAVEEPDLLGNETKVTEQELLVGTTKADSLQEIVNLDVIEKSVDDSFQEREHLNKALDIEASSEVSLKKKDEENEQTSLNLDNKEYSTQNINIPGYNTHFTSHYSSSIKVSEVSNNPPTSPENEIGGKHNSQLGIKTAQIQNIPGEESKQSENLNPIVSPQDGNGEEKLSEIISESIVSVTSSESVVTSPFVKQSLMVERQSENTEEKSKLVQDVKPVYEEPENQPLNINIDSNILPLPVDSSKIKEASVVVPEPATTDAQPQVSRHIDSNILPLPIDSSEIKEASVVVPEPATTDAQPQVSRHFDHQPTAVPPFFKERSPLPKQEEVPIYSAVAKDEPTVSIVEEKETFEKETSVPGEAFQASIDRNEYKLEEPQEVPKEEHSSFSTEAPTSEPSTEHGSVHEPLDEFITEDKSEEITTEPDTSGGLLSWLNPVLELFSSSEINQDVPSTPLDESSIIADHLDHTFTPRVQEDSCQAEGFGEGACGVLKPVSEDVEEVVKDSSWHQLLFLTDSIPATLELVDRIPLETTIWLIVTAVVVLIFSLGHYYIEAHRRDGPLVAVINKLEREVLILKKESSILDDRLHTAQEQVEAWNANSTENDALVVELRQELEETKTQKAELEEQMAVLEKEVETATESAMEMHSLLSESLSSQDGAQVLLTTVETLREKLEHQENEISGLSQSLASKTAEVDELKDKLVEAGEVSVELENKIISLTREKEDEALELKDKHRQILAQLEEMLETKALDETRVSTEMSKLRLTIEELQKLLVEKDSELEEVKEVVKELRSTDSNEKMDALFDVVTVKAHLKAASLERDNFREKFLEEEGARKLLEGHMKKITQEVAELKNSFETAEKEKIEALTRLQVLSDYFKEKEGQLQKELGLKESLWLQKQSEDHTIYEQMRSLREENEKYKLQNESLKKEIVEQESSFKIQLANVEQKSHENWVASRQAERRLKEVQQEASQLRNRLTMEKSAANFSSLDDSKQMNESNGDPSSPPSSLIFPPTTSPPFMMYPPGDFVPPPPLLGSPYPSDSRPPPLGRISSPPLDHRFSPPPPYPPYEPFPPYGHHSPSPPPPLPPYTHHRNVHKPQPREMPRDPKDHSMSNYSPETEKPSRRNKR